QQRFERHTLQLEALTQMGQIALASLDLETVLKNVVDEILALMRCEHIYVLLSDNGDLVFAAVGGEGADALRGRRIPAYTGVAGQVMGNGHAVRMSSGMPHGNVFQEIAQASDQPVQTLLAAPLRLGSRLIGVVEAVHSDPDAFNEEDLRLLEAAASWASIAIHNARQHDTIRRRLQESEAMASISRALNETVDLERILQMIVDAAQQIIPTVERTVIHLLDEEQRALRPVAVAGMHEPRHPDFTMQTGEGVAGHAIAEGTVINVRDTHSDPRYISLGTATHLRSLLVAPVQTGSRPLGTISVQSAAVNAFSADDERLLMMLGIDAAIAIENARLFEAEREQARRLTAIGQMAQQISKSLVLDELLHRAVDLVQQTFGYYYVDVLLVDLPAGEIVLRASASPSGRRLYEGYRLKIGQQGIAGWVAGLGQPLLVNDVAREPRYHLAPELADTRSELAVPIPGPAGLIGVLDVQSIERDAFDEADLTTLQAFAGHLAVALENAQLYSDLTRSLQQEQEMRAQLIQAAKLGALGRLTASLTHEINNPLQSVQGCLTLAREELESQQRRDKMERYLGIAGTEIERISTIVRNMREFYRPARADLQLTDLHAILRSVLELSSKQLQHSSITFKRMWADDLPKIEANPDHLKQVFLNLVLNAVDSMPEGGTLSISTSRDEIRPGNGHPAQPAVKVQLSDTGKGMPPEVMSRLFEPFVTTKEHGSGLGLSISYRIIQSHNGQFSVASQEGKGSTFSILLPLQQPAAGDEPPLGD
ncbi:MAG TPA: GAF domain-containing protein, partial [Anaerolineales bacterium]|nr:GAF domain-containing protein [Anaerolineales bacterium]